MFGKGIVKGLGITLNRMFHKKVTELYPDVMPSLPERSRGTFEFEPEKCISCELCINACPNKAIKLEYSKPDKKRLLDKYSINQGYCLYCGLCEEACPTKAITFTSKFESSYFNREDIERTWAGPKRDEQPVQKPAEADAETKAEIKAEELKTDADPEASGNKDA